MLNSYPFAFFTAKHDNRPQQRHMTWERFVEHMQKRNIREEKDGRLFSPVEYKPGTNRSNANIEAIGCLVLDGDHAGTVESFCEKWNALGLAYCVYSTHSHTPEEPRWRVILPLASEFHIEAPEQWRRFYRAAAQALGGSLVDDSCKDPARMHYLPSCPPGMEPHAFCILQDGRALDAAEIHVQEPEQKPAAPAQRRVNHAASRNEAERLLDTLVDRAVSEQSFKGRHKAGVDLACQFRDNMSEFGYSEGDALAAMQQYQSAVANMYDRVYAWKEAEETFHRIMQTAARTAWERREMPSVWGETTPEPARQTAANPGPEKPEFPDYENADFLHEMRSDSPEISGLLTPVSEPEKEAGNEGEEDTESTQIGQSLFSIAVNMEKRIRRSGGIPEKYGLTLPPDMDVESLIRVGAALKGGEDRLNTLLFFTWSDWWRAVGVHVDLLPPGQKKGRKMWILGRVYRGYNQEFLRKKREELTDNLNILNKISAALPKENRDMSRTVHFYKLLSQFSEEEQRYWLDQPRERVTVRMAEAIEAQKPPPNDTPPSSDSIEGDCGEDNSCSNNFLSMPGKIVYSATGEVLAMDPARFVAYQTIQDDESIQEMNAVRSDAMLRGVTVPAYLRALRTGQPLPELLPPVEFPPNEPEDDGLIGVAKLALYTVRPEKPVYHRSDVSATHESDVFSDPEDSSAAQEEIISIADIKAAFGEGCEVTTLPLVAEEAPSLATALPTGAEMKDLVRQLWQEAKQGGHIEPSPALLSRILHRPVERMSKAFEEATEDDLVRLLHYVKRGELIPPGADPTPYLNGAIWMPPAPEVLDTETEEDRTESPVTPSIEDPRQFDEGIPMVLCWRCNAVPRLGLQKGIINHFCASCDRLNKEEETITYAQIALANEARKRARNGHNGQEAQSAPADSELRGSALWDDYDSDLCEE